MIIHCFTVDLLPQERTEVPSVLSNMLQPGLLPRPLISLHLPFHLLLTLTTPPSSVKQPSQQNNTMVPGFEKPARTRPESERILKRNHARTLERMRGTLQLQYTMPPAHSPSTEWNQTESPLLRLPAELRNRIYVFALGTAHVQFEMLASVQPRRNDLCLPRTCRQIKSETAPFLVKVAKIFGIHMSKL